MKVRERLVWAINLAFLLCLLPSASRAGGKSELYKKLDVFAQVLHAVRTSYVDDVSVEKLVYGAIRGMLRTLDPHSAFMTPRQFKALQEDTEGHFGGVGIVIEMKQGRLLVVSPIEDSPAARAGIKAGDWIVKIDGKPTEEMDTEQASRMIRGVPGTKVVLTIEREELEKPKDFILIRQRIRLNPVEASMPVPGYAVVRIKTFQERTDRLLKDALDRLRKQAGGKLKGLVLDLRNNPGGLLDQAIRVADRFLEKGVIVETRGRGKRINRSYAHRQGTEPFYPMVCLVNGGSASAAEIVAGALQDHGRAVIMGTRSFGKGSVQKIFDLRDGSGLKLTIARYYTPNERSIQEEGIVPDVMVPAKEPSDQAEFRITREVDLRGHLKPKAIRTTSHLLDDIKDYQLRTALKTLKVWEKFTGSARGGGGR
ncbi:MAG: S41 family peptidase [Deltaproteobacteria bacterium]|nr:MAG: S41 family peptidase [Deltaproteobacteria bacterium]